MGFDDDGEGECENTEYAIERVVLASESKHGWQESQYYASAVKHGGADTFWAIQFYTIDSFQLPSRNADGHNSSSPTIISTGSSSSPRYLFESSSRAKPQWLMQVDEWCFRNLDTFYSMSASGNRGPSALAQKLLIRSSRVFTRSRNGEFIRAAIANGLNTMCGVAVA